MKDLNHFVLIGRLTSDGKIGDWNNQSKLDFCVATNNTKKNGDKWEDDPSFIYFTLWGNRANALASRLVKGTQVCIEGHLKTTSKEKDGKRVTTLTPIVDEIQLLGGKRADSNNNAQPSPSASEPVNAFDENIFF